MKRQPSGTRNGGQFASDQSGKTNIPTSAEPKKRGILARIFTRPPRPTVIRKKDAHILNSATADSLPRLTPIIMAELKAAQETVRDTEEKN